MTAPTPARFLRMPALSARIGLERSSIYRMVRAGLFPQPVRLTSAAVAWRVDEIEAWEAALPRAAQPSDSARMSKVVARRPDRAGAPA